MNITAITVNGKELEVGPRLKAIILKLWDRRKQIEEARCGQVTVDMSGKSLKFSWKETDESVKVDLRK